MAIVTEVKNSAHSNKEYAYVVTLVIVCNM